MNSLSFSKGFGIVLDKACLIYFGTNKGLNDVWEKHKKVREEEVMTRRQSAVTEP